jgi:hypothetical protein
MAENIRQAADPLERAAARVAGLVAYTDPSDPLQLTAVPLLLIDVIAAEEMLPPQRCIDDCLTLVHAYAQLGVPAQVHAVELTVTDTATGTSATHGGLDPRWGDGQIHGHTIVWLSALGHLVDATAEEFA